MDSTPVEDSTDSKTLIARGHCVCLPRKAMMAIPHSMNYGYNEVDSTPVEDSTDSKTLIARGHCVCLPRKAMMVMPHAMNLWIKPTNPHATAAVVDLWSKQRGPSSCGGQHGL